MGSARKVCLISGSGWKDASSGCDGAGCDAGRTRSKRRACKGEWVNEPRIRETESGLTNACVPFDTAGVGGRELGGFARFCETTA